MKRLSSIMFAGTCLFLLSTAAQAFPISQIGSFQDVGSDDTIGFAGSYAPADWLGPAGRWDDPFWEMDFMLNQSDYSLRLFLISDYSASEEINLYIPGVSYEYRSTNDLGNVAFLSGFTAGVPLVSGSSDTQVAGLAVSAWVGGVLAIGSKDKLHLDLSARLGAAAFAGPLVLGGLTISIGAGLRIPLGKKAWLHPELSLGCNYLFPGGVMVCTPVLGTALAI